MIALLYNLEDEELEEENISSAANNMLYNNFYYTYASIMDSIRERQSQLMYLNSSMNGVLGGNYTPVYSVYGQELCKLKK